ncbi:MAG: NAD(P)/FAD-dependent oxidoreductase, partial [Proteobacteria bacterium]|nr:NAD(P)/FAD-dependent oxidoreductase [Pseudomonadota bacterium]
MRENYDLIVIGSGIGGLTAALTASREGKNVLMLEGAKNFGGYINPFKRQNYHFDPGVHYLGELGEGQRFRKLLDHLGLQEVKFNELNPEGFDWYIFPDYQIKFGASLDNYEKQLITDFPHEKKGIHQFFKIIHRLEDANSAFLQMKGLKGLVKALPYISHFMKRGKATLEEILDTYFMDQKLKAVIAAPCGDIGLPPSQIHGLIHLGVISHYSRGAYFPCKKTDLRNEIVKKLEIQGVVLKNRSTVTRIMDRKGVVTGVELENGEQFFSQTVISNAQAGETFKMIDPSRLSQKESLSLKNLEHSISSICVFLGVNDGIDTSIIQNRNIWFYSTYDINGLYEKAQKGETKGDEFIFLSIPTMKDTKGERA